VRAARLKLLLRYVRQNSLALHIDAPGGVRVRTVHLDESSPGGVCGLGLASSFYFHLSFVYFLLIALMLKIVD
jgi:hypothetical protein